MGGIKKIIAKCDKIPTIISQLHSSDYDHIELFYHPNPRHKKAGLVESQVLIIAYCYKPRPDKQGKVIVRK